MGTQARPGAETPGPARPPLPATAGETSPENPWPVRMLTMKLGDYLAKAPALWVEGQIVEVTRRQTTCYLTLRDADVDMSFSVTTHARVLDSLTVPLVEGARVVAHVRAQLWPKRGSLNLSADQVRPVGVGELLARLEHLRRVLAAEGLFAPERKRRLPFLPRVIGLVCGRNSAAERDVVENARRRWPAVRFDVRQVAVQGATAVAEVTEAIAALDAEPEVDVIVVARGGGSLEDLLPFSNEALVRAAAACRTPLVSAIGHEVDTPLLDLVADLRASTPTDAAKRVVPDLGEEDEALRAARGRLRSAWGRRLEAESALVRDLRARPALAQPRRTLDEAAGRVEELRARARRTLGARLDRAHDDVDHLLQRVVALSPAATLARGYAVVLRDDGALVRSPGDVADGDGLDVRLASGRIAATVTDTSIPPAAASPSADPATDPKERG